MANEIYHRSNWGNAVNDIAWGDVYEKFDATNEMFVRSDNYENSNETDKLMAAINPKPSILLTPTAYDNGSLHSVKPVLSPFADFDFTRGTTATRVNEQGLIEDVQILSGELVQNGDFDTDSDWVKGTGWTISGGKANAVNASNQSLSQSTSSVLLNKKYRISFDVEYISGSAKFQLVGGTAQDVITITSSGTKVIEVVSDANKTSYRIKGLTTGSGFNGSIDNISIIEITDETDLPRIDYTDGTGSLLLEPQSTNLLPYSEDFSQWNALGDTSIEGGYLAPDGSNTAYKVSGGSSLLNFNNVSNETQTRTIYAKTVSGTGQAHLTSYFGNTNNLFTLNENWQRFEVNGTTTSTGAANFYAIDFRGSTDLTEVIIWGAQLEELSYATSYIPTSGSTVTRDADAANNSGSSDLINSTEGVLYCEIAALADNLTFRGIALSDGTTENRVMLRYRTTTNQINLFIRADSTTIVNSTKALTDITNYSKIAIKYKSGDIALWVDGVEAKTHTNTFTLIGLDRLNFDAGNGSDDFYGKVKSVAVFKEALTDEELTALTT